MERSNNKILLSIIGVAIMVVALTGVTFAFFNYTRTGNENNITTGRISFNTIEGTSINLSNVFPISSEEAQTDTTNAKTLSITVTGDTDYTRGVEYLVTASDVHLEANGKTLPIALEVDVANNGTGNLGTAETGDYYTNRNSYTTSKYKVEYNGNLQDDAHILVGYIAPNTTSGTIEGINGVINIKAYIDASKILISDTYNDGNTPTDEKGTPVELGEGKTVFTTSEWNNLNLSFKIKVEANEGIWVAEPLTALETIKKNVNTTTQINFGNISSDTNGKGLYILPGTESDVNPIYYYRGAVTNNNVIFGGFCWQIVRTTDTGGIKMIYNGVATGDGKTCENTTGASRQLATRYAFNTNYESVSDVGYMYNQRYAYDSSGWTKNALFGSTATWVTDHYELTDASVTTPDTTHHYSCNATTSDATCTSLRYVYYVNGTTKYYITLTNGDTIEDALYKMTGNGTASTKAKNASYVLNRTDSKAKTEIENWFKTNLTNEEDASKTNYQEYLEDTIYCNDRSYKETGSSNTYNQSGWNPNGGDITKRLYFGTLNRFNNSNWYSKINIPSMECENVTDRFSVSNQEAKLKYPVGLLTADEIILAGAAGNSTSTYNRTYYLYTENYYWSLSPDGFYSNGAGELSVFHYGYLDATLVSASYGLRPVVSLKLGTEFEDGGEGTILKPYVVKTSE